MELTPVSVGSGRRPLLNNHAMNNMDDMYHIPPAHCTKVFLQRDYSEGTGVKFQVKFPSELEGKIERQEFINTMEELNRLYAEAETLSGKTCCESCFACLTAYLSYLCMRTHYEKMLKKMAIYVRQQNERVYLPKGLLLIDPAERGLRVVEICLLNDTGPR